MGDGVYGVHGAIVCPWGDAETHNGTEQEVAIDLGQLMSVQSVLVQMSNTKTVRLMKAVVRDTLDHCKIIAIFIKIKLNYNML